MIDLSICIPTWNRGEFIGATLDSILADIPAGVEIVVLDGGSTDGTEALVGRYVSRYECVRYIRQESNSGVDADMDRSISLAKGVHCWLMSSDDLLQPGSVARVLEECKQGFDLIIVDAEIRNFEMSSVIRPSIIERRQDVLYEPADWERFFVDVGSYLSFMPAVVIRRHLWLSRERATYYKTGFLHFGVIFQKPIEGRIRVIAQPLLSIRYGNWTWASRAFQTWLFDWPDLVWSMPDFSRVAKRQVCPRGGWREILRVLYHRSLGGVSIKDSMLYLKRDNVQGVRAWLVRVIPHLPARALNLLALLWYSLRRNRETVYLLRNCEAYWMGNHHAVLSGSGADS